MNLKQKLKVYFSKREPITILAHGPVDFLGEAYTVLSDGSGLTVRDPMIGKKVGTLIYEVKVLDLPDEAGFSVQIEGEEPFKISTHKAVELLNETRRDPETM